MASVQAALGDGVIDLPSKRDEKKLKQMGQKMVKEETKIRIRKVKSLLKKPEHERTPEEKDFLSHSIDEVLELQRRNQRNNKLKDHKLEKEEDEDEVEEKSKRLAEMLATAHYAIVYTGAGISTAASIPDYRGPNGVWTMMSKGKKSTNAGTEQALQLAIDISKAEPTFTHMAITKLVETGIVKHVVSQNCDGLHLRSGLPQNRISEIHGNMNIEVCGGHCTGPKRIYTRNYDVTKKTAYRRHWTDNKCTHCGSQLKDTIVHFGEKGPTEPRAPHHWPAAARAAKKADLIVCIGSSLKILRKYSCLWNMERKKRERARIVIVNLQWTPKDNSSSLKINGRCDEVMRKVMRYLRFPVPVYIRSDDPIFGPNAALMAAAAAAAKSSHSSSSPIDKSDASEDDDKPLHIAIPSGGDPKLRGAGVYVQMGDEEEQRQSIINLETIVQRETERDGGGDTDAAMLPPVSAQEVLEEAASDSNNDVSLGGVAFNSFTHNESLNLLNDSILDSLGAVEADCGDKLNERHFAMHIAIPSGDSKLRGAGVFVQMGNEEEQRQSVVSLETIVQRETERDGSGAGNATTLPTVAAEEVLDNVAVDFTGLTRTESSNILNDSFLNSLGAVAADCGDGVACPVPVALFRSESQSSRLSTYPSLVSSSVSSDLSRDDDDVNSDDEDQPPLLRTDGICEEALAAARSSPNIPGWFGKGWQPRKSATSRKRKKARS